MADSNAPFGLDEYGVPIGTVEGAIARKNQVDLLRQGSNSLLATALTNVVPDRALPGPLGYVPFVGMAEGMGGFAHLLGSKAAQVGNAVTDRWGLHIPEPPDFLKQAGEHFDKTKQEMAKHVDDASSGVLTVPDPNTAVGMAADIVGSGIGAGVGLAPGAIANAAPRGLKTITSLLLPSLEHAPRSMAIGGAIGTGLGAAEEAQALASNPNATAPVAAPAAVTAPAPTSAPAPAATPSSLTDIAFAPTPPTAAVPAPSAIPKPAMPSLTDAMFNSQAAPGPTFTQQGNTGTSVGIAALEVLGTLGAIAAGGHMYRRGAAVDAAARDARLRDPAYAAKVQDYNNDVISRGPNANTISPPNGAPVNAPLPEGSAVRRATVATADALANDAAKIQDAVVLTSPDPSTAERMSAAVGNKFDTQLQQNKVRDFLRTGFDERTNTRIPSMEGLLDDFSKLDRTQKTTLAEGLRSLNELDNRANNMAKLPRGQTPNINEIRHDFVGKSDAQLAALGQAMRSDPALADIAGRYKQITDGLVKIGEHQNYGFFPTAEAQKLLRQHPNYVPEMDANGKPIHPFGERATTAYTGQAQVTSHPIFDLAQHVEQMYPLFEHNLSNREIVDHFRAANRQNPQAAQFIQDVAAPTGPHATYYPTSGLGEAGGQARDPVVTVRTSTGVQHMRIDNPVVYNAMNSHSRGAAHIRMDAWARLRRMYTQGTTGALSLATGRAIPLRNAAYTAMSAPVNAPKNMYGGALDRIVQRSTGHTSSVARALDMSANIPGTVGSYGLGVLARRARNAGNLAGNVFANTANNPLNKALRAAIGDAQVDKMAGAAQRFYETTNTAKLERMGLSGAGSPMHLAAPGVVPGTKAGPFGDPKARMRLESARLSPKAFFDGQWMGAKPFMMNIQHAASEFAGHISDAGHDYIGRLNLDNPNMSREALTYELRNLTGNASRKGSSGFAHVATSVLPYANVSMQGIGRRARAYAERPAAAPLTQAMGLGSMALLSILTHMRSGDHLDFLENLVSLQQRAANVMLATNDDPLKPTVIPLAQEDRAAYAFVLDVMSKAVNTVAARHDKVSFNNLWEGLQDFFGSHITTSNALAIRHGAIDTLDFLNPPPILGKFDWNHVAENGLQSIPGAYEPLVGKGTLGNNAAGQLPQQEASGAPFDTKSGQMLRNVLSNTFGAVAHVLDTGNAMIRYHTQQGHSAWDSAGMGIRDWLQQSRESNMSLNNMLFETPLRLAVRPPIVETLQPSLNALKQLPALPKPLNQGYVGTGPNRLPVPVYGDHPTSQEPFMLQMLQSAHAYNKRVNEAMKPIVALKAQMGAVSRMGMNPEQRRDWLNNQTRIIADRYKLVDAYVTDLNAQMSKFAGKPIRFTDIDWSKGRAQFQN